MVPVRLPPLRDRREDIPQIAAAFLLRASAKYRREGLSLTPAAVAAMTAYDWPGNVRQLENLIERVAILTPGPDIGPEAFADEFRPRAADHGPAVPAPVPTTVAVPTPSADVAGEGPRLVDQIEKQAILDALTKHQGSVRDAAHLLGLSQATVYRKIKRYGINLDDFGKPAPSPG